MLASTVLAALEALDDTMLRAVVARAQGHLLDRPAIPDEADGLAVEVVDHEERLLLATYRALGPESQRRVRDGAGWLRRQDATAAEPPVTVATILHRGVAQLGVAERAQVLIGGSR